MSSEEAISDQRPAISPKATDPLADANCLKCGYPLRGLPENRCPECGTAFDPQEMASTFVTRWPLLLMWYLIVHMILLGPDLPHVRRCFLILIDPSTSAIRPIFVATTISSSLNLAMALLVGPLAAFGLYRRRDWARKACLAIFAAAFLEPVADLWSFVCGLIDTGDLKPTVNTVLTAISGISFCVLPLLLIGFLSTALRRHSLARRGDRGQPPFLIRVSHPRQDWLLLSVLLLAGWGIAQTCWGIDSLAQSLPFLLRFGWASIGQLVCTWYLACQKAYFTWTFLMGFYALVAAFRIWQKPQLLRRLLTAVTVVSGPPLLLSVLGVIASLHSLRHPIDSRAVEAIASVILGTIGPILTPLTLLLFACLAVDREDINRLAREQ
jgi:hypothetical protein